MNTRTDDTTRELPVRTDADEAVAELSSIGDPLPADVARQRDGALPRRERAGSPSPMALDGAPSWQDIKSRFVDDPAGAIGAAEELVRLAVERRIRTLKDEASALCARGRDDESSSTEGLRTRLIRYQEYCQRLAETSLH